MEEKYMQALLWEGRPDKSVVCRLCAQACRLKPGEKGLCGVRVNRDGGMVTLVGDVVTSVSLDPMEKKPLYHFLPGTRTFSAGSAGCNFSCRFCQNDGISQLPAEGRIPGKRAMPEDLVALAREYGTPSMAFTYNEPTVFFELVYATAGLAVDRGLRCLLVSNGFMSQDCLRALEHRICAANIDIKSFSDRFYRHYCHARLQPVLDSCKRIKEMGWWLEVTTLVIPGVNDSPDELGRLAAFIHDELGPDTPWHISGFHGAYLMADHPSTPLATLEQAWRLGRQTGLNYVYIGNAASAVGANTFCPHCGALVVERAGYAVRLHGRNGLCPACGAHLAGVWS